MQNIVFTEIRAVCRHMLQAYDRMNSPHTSKEDKARFTVSIDENIQDSIIEALERRYPGHLFLAEEPDSDNQQTLPDHPAVWIIDPIDGSSNYLHHIPCFSISICFYDHGEPCFAIVYDPIADELFSATKGNGALLNQHRIQTSLSPTLATAMCGIETQTNADIPPLSFCHSTRKMGCTSLTLCYVACARFDLAICQSPHLWDYAAGLFIAKEAGAFVYNHNIERYEHGDDYLYVSSKGLRDQLACR